MSGSDERPALVWAALMSEQEIYQRKF